MATTTQTNIAWSTQVTLNALKTRVTATRAEGTILEGAVRATQSPTTTTREATTNSTIMATTRANRATAAAITMGTMQVAAKATQATEITITTNTVLAGETTIEAK